MDRETNIDSIRTLEMQIRERERAITMNLKRARILSSDASTLPPQSISSDETNTESVQTVEEETREHKSAIIELKRTRNSLLNVSKLPPEALGDIFRWNAAPTSNFLGWVDGSHNFLLVCRHWFEVGSRTPELWSFWGTTLKEWKLCCRHSGTAPLDLVLNGNPDDRDFDAALGDVLRDRATRDSIRRIYLNGSNSKVFTSIVSSLTVNCEGFRSNSLESFILLNYGGEIVDLTNFFARCHFPKLRQLELSSYTATRWDSLWSRTGALTTLTLDSGFPSSIPSTSELFSMLASNPALQRVSVAVLPARNGITSPLRLPVHQLEQLTLSGDMRDVVGVLRRLDHPNKMDLNLRLQNCTVGDISQVVSPYLRDYAGCRGRPRNGWGLFISESGDTIWHNVGDVGSLDPSTPWDRVSWFLSVVIHLDATLPKDLLERTILDLLAHMPQEEVAYFHGIREPFIAMETISTHFPNVRALHFDGAPLSALSSLGGGGEIFPSLQHVFLDRAVVDDDWSPLTTSLARLASSGNQLDTFEIFSSPHMCIEVMEKIGKVVRNFRTEAPDMRRPCPFDTCSAP